jgi:hypothetical protein
MPAVATLKLLIDLLTNEGVRISMAEERVRWSPPGNGDRREYTIASATFQALVIPTGADYLVIFPRTATSLILKGVTGDTGVPITKASSPDGGPIVLSLGPAPSVGILNNGASSVTIEVIAL